MISEVPLALHQVGVFAAQQLAPDSHALQAVIAMRIAGRVDPETLQTALDRLLQRHAALRTTFHAGSPLPIQRVHAHLDAVFEHVPASGWSDSRLRARVLEDARRPFDLTRGCFRCVLYTGDDASVLALGGHHIGLDLISTEIYLGELPSLYAAVQAGCEPEPSPRGPSFLDFVRWQNDFLTGGEAEQSIQFWAQELAETPAADLPTDRPRRPVRAACGASLTLRMPPETVSGLRVLDKSLNRTLLAVFQTLLFRYSGQPQVITGMPAGLRPSPEYARVMGNFVNMIAVRGDFSGNPTVREVIDRVSTSVSRAAKHRQIPLALLVERLRPRRDPSITPFFQVAMGLQGMRALPELSACPMPGAEWRARLGPFEAQSFEAIEHEGQFDLSLFAAEADNQLWLAFKYSTALFDRTTIERMAANFLVLARAMAGDPSARIGSLPLMTDAERKKTVVLWNDTASDPPPQRCIHDLVADAARRAPTAVAVVQGAVELTYRELMRRATVLARALRQRGARRDDIVAVVLPRTPDAIVAMLAAMMAGGAFLPIDPALPQERIGTILGDARVRLAITSSTHLEALGVTGVEVIAIDSQSVTDSSDGEGDLAHVNEPSDLAYVIYTSGSTGTPKGVLLSHLGLVNNVTWIQKTFDVASETRVAQVIALGFDGSILEIWPALASGATLHMVDDATRLSPQLLVAWMRRERIQYTVLPTPLAEMVLELDEDLPALRVLLAGGDKLHRPKRPPTFQLYNGYGPTESTVITTFHLVTWDDADETVPIGRPVANTRVYLLDAQLQPVPIGARGELCIGGVTIARGYLHRPELEAEKFIPDHISGISGERLYRTGDLARYRSDGTLEFLGRIDNQVKLRGFRIELGEIESVLTRHPAVREAVVLLRQVAGAPHLVAYVVADLDRRDPAIVRAFLGQRLPEYMVPSFVVFLDQLPLTPVGKIDVHALPEPRRRPARSVDAAATPTEEKLARLWQEVLDLEVVSVTDDFFELGGDSLLAMRLAAAIARELGREVPVADLFRRTSIRDQAAHLAPEAEQAQGSATVVTLRSGGRPALIVPHTILGSVISYRPLAEAIGDSHAVLAIAPSQRAPSEDLKRIASEYVGVLRERDPEGPYALCGWSWGGLLALEMAQQLARSGAEVPLVALINSPFPTRLSFPDAEAGLVARFFSFFLPPGVSAADYVDSRASDPLASMVTALQSKQILSGDLSVAQIHSSYQAFRAYAFAMHRYRPEPWSGRALFFRAAAANPGRGDWGAEMGAAVSMQDWRATFSQMIVEDIDATHFDILAQPHVPLVAERLRSHLRG
jgi:amino acid adenylation domain-containing protein